MRVGGGKNKFNALGRLFKGLEHGVKRMPSEHVDLINNVNLKTPCSWSKTSLLKQLLNFSHRAIGGGVDFHVVDKTSRIYFLAGPALAAGLSHKARLAVQSFGKDTGKAGFTNPP